MKQKSLLFLHGFASSAQGSKAQFLRQKCQSLHEANFYAPDFNPTPRDFEYMTVTGIINRLRQIIIDRQLENVRLIGSSMGALVALNYAHRFGGVENLLLLAPALAYRSGAGRAEMERWRQAGVSPVFHYAFNEQVPLRYAFEEDGMRYAGPPSPPTKMLIIHGRSDDVLPIEDSRAYAVRHSDKAQLVEVDSDHRLNDQLDLIWQFVATFSLR